jgi:hypothetical protein
MATSNKDFKVKYGLIVEGANATVNGNQVLTEDASDQYIIDLIGGETLVTSVESTQMEVINGELNIKSGVFDASGAASQALSDANDYTDTALEDYTPTASLDTTVGGYGYLKSGDLPTMYSDSDVDAHLSGTYPIEYNAGDISIALGEGGGLTTDEGGLYINRTTVDAWYDANGAASDVAIDLSDHESDTSTHGVTGTIVGTSDTQTLSNKTVSDSLKFQDGVNNYSAIYANAENLKIDGSDDIVLTTNNGDIILNPDGAAYVGSVTAENEIATHGYVDNAISGLTWKQSVNLLYNAAIPVLSGSGATQLIVDGHDVLGDADSGYRLLLAGGTSTDGIYVYNSTAGSWTLTRAEDADAFGELVGAAVYVMEGTQYGSTSWVQGNHYLTDFTGQSWTQFSGQGSVTAGDGIVVDGLEVSVDFTVVAELQDLTDGLALKQDILTAGDNIDISGVTISVTGLDSADISDFATAAQSAGTGYFDPAGSASSAQTAAELYADGLAVNYDPAGAAATAEQNAIAHADALTTDDVAEGTNLYFTDGRAASAAATLLTSASLTNITITGSGAGLTITAENGVGDSNTDQLSEGSNNYYFTEQRAIDALQDTTPNFVAVEIDSIAKQVAATVSAPTALSQITAYSFAKADYRSAKFLVKTSYGVHTELSEVLLTLDTVADNISITEYATVGTNGSSMTITADIDGANVRLRVTPVNNSSTVTVMGTLLV